MYEAIEDVVSMRNKRSVEAASRKKPAVLRVPAVELARSMSSLSLAFRSITESTIGARLATVDDALGRSDILLE